MTSVSGGQLDSSTRLTRRLSVLPAALGLLAIAVLLGTARVVVDGEPAWAGTAVLLSAVAVAVTVATGHPVGLYTGLLVYGIAIVAADVDSSARSLAAAVVAALVVHELVRISLDARRPARFGPRFWVRTALRTAALAAALVALVAFASAVADTELPTWLVPIALAASALPMLVRRLAVGSDETSPTGRTPSAVATLLWIGLAVLAAGVTGAVATLGATARSQIERTSPTSVPHSEAITTSTSVPSDSLVAEPSGFEPVLAAAMFLATMLIVGAILIALRRREMIFDLDELDMGLDDSTLGFEGPGQADLDDRIEIGEDDMGRLLADLALDIASERDPGRAIRFAYANVERRLADLGVERQDSETEQEFLVRAIPALEGGDSAMVELTELFEQARFGHVAVSESMRGRALAAVDRLRDALGPAIDPATDPGAAPVDGEAGR